MYKIYYEETLILDDTSTSEEIQLLDTTFTQSANSAGSLEFTMYPNNSAYDSIRRMRGLVKVHKNGSLIWEGRVLSEKTDFWKRKQIYCEGILACLNDTRQPQIVYSELPLRSYIESILSIHNQKVDDSKKFETGIVTVNDGATIGTRTTNYDSTWDIFKGLVDEFGGYLYVRYANGHRYLDFRKQCPRTSSQKIEFGVNLMDFTKSYDMSTLCTVLLPLGQVVAYAGGSAIGEAIDARVQTGYYLDENCEIQYDSGLAGHYNGSSSYFPVQAGKTYYISCRNHGGRVMYALRDSSFNLISSYSASTGEGMTDLIETPLDVPPSDVGANYQLAIAGFGYDIQPRVNESIEASNEFDKYTTVESVNNGSLYVANESAVTTYGWIEKQLTWANITDPTELKTLAEKYLTEGQFDEMALDVKALDLQSIGVDTDRIDILDEIQVVSEPHGLNKLFPVTELTVKIGDPSGTTFTLGSKTEQSLTGLVSSTNDEIYAKLNQIPSRSAILESARNNATMIINNTLSGIFMLEQNDDGTNIGFRISNVEDWDSEGAKGWRFTMGGLGYFGDGFNRPVTLALTGEDGGIVANCVTTGTMYADRIHGGTLTLGGYNNDNGIVSVRDAAANEICRLDNNGARIVGTIEDSNNAGYWMRMADGSLTGGRGNDTLTTINATSEVIDADHEITYRGMSIVSDVINLGCSFFVVDGATGVTDEITYASNVTATSTQMTACTVSRWNESEGQLYLTSATSSILTDVSTDYTTIHFHKGIMCTGMGV